MRSFEERKEEILKRSNEIIKKKKRRKKIIISFCIPLCVFLSFVVIMTGYENFATEIEDDVSTASTVTVEINMSDGQVNEKAVIKDRVQTDELSNLILASIANSMSVSKPFSQIDDGSAEDALYSRADIYMQKNSVQYEFILISGNEKQIYKLNGNILSDSTNGINYLLSEENVSEFTQMISNITDWEEEQ